MEMIINIALATLIGAAYFGGIMIAAINAIPNDSK